MQNTPSLNPFNEEKAEARVFLFNPEVTETGDETRNQFAEKENRMDATESSRKRKKKNFLENFSFFYLEKVSRKV